MLIKFVITLIIARFFTILNLDQLIYLLYIVVFFYKTLLNNLNYL